MTSRRPHTKRRLSRCSSGTSTRRSTRLLRGKSWSCNSDSALGTDTSTHWPKSASSCKSAVNASVRSKTKRCKNCGGSTATASTHITRSFSTCTSTAMDYASPTRSRAFVRPRRPHHHPPLFQRSVRDHPGAPVRVAVEHALRFYHVLRLVDDQRAGVVRPGTRDGKIASIKQRSQVLTMDRPDLKA